MKIYLIRHTRVAVEPGTIYGFTDVDVAESFTEEARAVATHITKETFDAVYSSPLSRCRKLAASCGYPDPVTDDRLKEMNFGDWEMQNWNQLQDPLLEQWYEDWIHLPARNGESFHDQYRRVSNFLDELVQKNYQKVCLFVHSGVVRCCLVHSGQTALEEAFRTEIGFGSCTLVELSKD